MRLIENGDILVTKEMTDPEGSYNLPVTWRVTSKGLVCVIGNNGYEKGDKFDCNGWREHINRSVQSGSISISKETIIKHLLNEIDQLPE